MTNSDRLQEIRERAEKPHDYFWTTPAGNAAVDDRDYLLQLVTEQQREIEELREELDGMAKTSGRWIAAAIEAGV